MMLPALAFLVTCAYWPGIASAATCPRWTILGIGIPLLLMIGRHRMEVTIAHVAGALFVAWAFFTYLWSGSPDDTIGSAWKLAILSGAFCLGSQIEDMKPIYRAMALGLIPCGGIAIAQYFGWKGLFEFASPSGLFVNRNFYAEACAMVAVGLIAEGDWKWSIMTGPGLLLTGARGALLGLFSALVAMVGRSVLAGRMLQARRRMVSSFTFAAVALLAGNALAASPRYEIDPGFQIDPGIIAPSPNDDEGGTIVLEPSPFVLRKVKPQQCQNTKHETPPGVTLLCSATWAFWSTCHAHDLVYDWNVQGTSTGSGSKDHPGQWHIDPWEPFPVVIRGIELIVLRGPAPDWLMAGNGIVPDAMVYMAVPERHVTNWFPAETGMPMPARDDPALNPDVNYLDLHGGCMGGDEITVQYTVYYTVQ